MVATLVLSLAAQPTLAFTKAGDTTCAATKRVWVYSRAIHDVYHFARFHTAYWENLIFTYRERNTLQSATWWHVEYDVGITQWGAYCASI